MAPALVPADGVYVPSPTFLKPFDKASGEPHPSIDVETQVAHTVHLAKSGISGVVLMGSTGEAIHLTRQERFDLISGVRKGLDAAEVLEWLEDAHKCGAQWGLVLAPGYFGVQGSQAGMIEWFTIVADRSPLPILIVSNGATLSTETYVTPSAHPNIVGVKMTHSNVSGHLEVALHPQIDAANFRVYTGFGHQLGPAMIFGAAGAIDAFAAVFPKTVVRLFKLTSEHPTSETTLEEARKLQWLVSSAQQWIVEMGARGTRECIFRVLGFGHLEGGRTPLRGAAPEGEWQKEKWTALMSKMTEIEKSL